MPDLQSISDSSLNEFSDAGSMLNLQEVLDSGEASGEDMDSENGDGLEDWFSEVGKDMNDSLDSNWDDLALAAGSCEDFAIVANPEEVSAHVSPSFVNTTAPRRELYDSGTTHHISPYIDDFDSFTSITPKTFTAANKQGFQAVGMGNMVISVRNGIDIIKL